MTLTATKTAGELMAADYVYFYVAFDGGRAFANLLQEDVDVHGLYEFILRINNGNDDILVTLSAESADGYPSGSPDGGGGDDDGDDGGGGNN